MGAMLRRLPAVAGLAVLAGTCAQLAGHRAFAWLVRRGPGAARAGFTGKLVKKHLSFPDRAVASAIRAQEGDFRNWAEIRQWATGIADTRLLNDLRLAQPDQTLEQLICVSPFTYRRRQLGARNRQGVLWG
jgi:hypothetical protein